MRIHAEDLPDEALDLMSSYLGLGPPVYPVLDEELVRGTQRRRALWHLRPSCGAAYPRKEPTGRRTSRYDGRRWRRALYDGCK